MKKCRNSKNYYCKDNLFSLLSIQIFQNVFDKIPLWQLSDSKSRISLNLGCQEKDKKARLNFLKIIFLREKDIGGTVEKAGVLTI